MKNILWLSDCEMSLKGTIIDPCPEATEAGFPAKPFMVKLGAQTMGISVDLAVGDVVEVASRRLHKAQDAWDGTSYYKIRVGERKGFIPSRFLRID